MPKQDFGEFINWSALVAHRSKVLFVPNPKVACTTLKWALATAEGTLHSDAAVASQYPEPTEDLTIHFPAVHGMDQLGSVDAQLQTEVLTSPNWVRFCVTRSPYARVVSAWLNRVVLGVPGTISNGLAEQFEEGPDYGTAFRRFVRRLADDADLRRDTHFATQVSVLQMDRFPYTDVLDLGGLDAFLERLRASGPHRQQIVLGRPRNTSPKLDVRRLFDVKTAKLVDKLYADDFSRFGYATEDFPDAAAPYPVSDNEFALIKMVRERTERIVVVQSAAFEAEQRMKLMRGGRYALVQLRSVAGSRMRGLLRGVSR